MSSQSRPFTTIASMVFAVLALGHVLRLVFGVELAIGGGSRSAALESRADGARRAAGPR